MSDESRLSRMAARIALRTTDRYIIDPIFPNGAIHCLSGPPDIGKSTWVFQLLYEMEHHRTVLGGMIVPRKIKWAYIALDRSLRDTNRTLDRLGYADWDAPVFSHEEVVKRASSGNIEREPDLFDILNSDMFKDVELFVIEGLQGYLPNVGKGQSINKSHTNFIMQLRDRVLNKGRTIIAVTHTPKGSSASHDRENLLGSQGLIGGMGTIIKFDLPPDESGRLRGMLGADQTEDRLVTIMPKNSPKRFLWYGRGDNGRLELDASRTNVNKDINQRGNVVEIFETPADQLMVMEAHLAAYEGQQAISQKQINAWAKEAGMDEHRRNNWVKQMAQQGRLLREGSGNYRWSATR